MPVVQAQRSTSPRPTRTATPSRSWSIPPRSTTVRCAPPPTPRGSPATTSAATSRSSARGTHRHRHGRPLVTTNYGVSLVATGTPAPVDPDLDHRGALVPLRRQERPGADPLSRSPAAARWSTPAVLAGISPDRRCDRRSTTRPACTCSTSTRTPPAATTRRRRGRVLRHRRPVPALNTPRVVRAAAVADACFHDHQKPVSDSEAIFGQANWRLTDRPTLTGGLRRT